jgi:hypothetical protein
MKQIEATIGEYDLFTGISPIMDAPAKRFAVENFVLRVQ